MLHDRGEKADRPSDPQSVADQDLEAAKRVFEILKAAREAAAKRLGRQT